MKLILYPEINRQHGHSVKTSQRKFWAGRKGNLSLLQGICYLKTSVEEILLVFGCYPASLKGPSWSERLKLKVKPPHTNLA